ncbi:MAG: methylornithine synthase PylB [Deltaproteobacteria bacterium]|jgi:methylornithine synthase|nr:methylornithine synthase PylB [Deltaproteobacteria bacterium]
MQVAYKDITDKALDLYPLGHEELTRLILPKDEDERELLHSSARTLRKRFTGSLIFTYGFIYLSTICRNDCSFCFYRKSNGKSHRYRKTHEEVIRAAKSLAEQGVNLIDLTMGEDPDVEKRSYLEDTATLIREVCQHTSMPVMISPGLISSYGLELFREAGALFYACYQETHSPSLFGLLRCGQSYAARWSAKKKAKKTGLKVEDGVLCGVGESVKDLANSILSMKELGAAQVRAMAYVPPPTGKKENSSPSKAARRRELDMIAALRLSFPNALIPASLDVEGVAGLLDRLNAGANLITSFVPASQGLAGVAQAALDIENESRSLHHVLPLLEQLGLTAASPQEYIEKVKSL